MVDNAQAFDIESMADSTMIDKLPPVEVRYGATKDPEKRKVMDAEAKQEQIDKMALSPFTGIVCCYSFVDANDDETAVIRTPSDEKELLTNLFKNLSLKDSASPQIITWNGTGFDFNFIYTRAMLLDIDLIKLGVPPLSWWTKRYSVTPHCDMMQVIAQWSQKFMKLNDAGRYICGETKIEENVLDFPKMIAEGNGAQIGEYCKQDARLVLNIYNKAKKYLF